MPLLQVNIVYVYENERVWTVLKLTCLPVVSILASASASRTPSVAVAVLPAIIQGQHVDILVIREDASVGWKWWVFNVVKAFMASAGPHILPPSRTNVFNSKHGKVLVKSLL